MRRQSSTSPPRLGKTKRIDAKGISDTKNEITAYTIVQAESHEAAAELFANHPYFMIFPGQSVDVYRFPKFSENLGHPYAVPHEGKIPHDLSRTHKVSVTFCWGRISALNDLFNSFAQFLC